MKKEMMKKALTSKKIKLHRETLRSLEAPQLREVAGASKTLCAFTACATC